MVALTLTGLLATAVAGQEYQVFDDPLPIASINRDRLFSESAYGRALLVRLSNRQQALVAENDKLRVELEQEERELTDLRKQITPEEFAPLAAAFDEKVKQIRQTQEEKSTKLSEELDSARFKFFRQSEDIIRQLMAERGIVYVLDEQAVLLTTGEGDITALAIERLDLLFENGTLRVADP